MHRHFPTPAEMAERGGTAAGEWHTWDAPWPEFPFHSSRLNALVLHDRVVELAEGLLGTTELTLYMGIMTAKYAEQASGYNQLLHADYPNHMLVVPRHALWLPAGGVLRLPHRRDHPGRRHAVRLLAEDEGHPRRAAHTQLCRLPELYADPSDAAAPAGSVVAYRPDVYHRSVDFTDPTRYRVMLHVSFRHREAGWGGYQAWPFRGFSPELAKFVQQATPRSSRSWVCPNRAIPTGTRPRWPASKPAIRASTWVPGEKHCADRHCDR